MLATRGYPLARAHNITILCPFYDHFSVQTFFSFPLFTERARERERGKEALLFTRSVMKVRTDDVNFQECNNVSLTEGPFPLMTPDGEEN